MISPRNPNLYQEKHRTYPAPNQPHLEPTQSSWQQNSDAVRFENEQLDISNRASAYNSNYVGAVGGNDTHLDPQLRRSQTMPDHLNGYQASHSQNGNDSFQDNPYSRAPFANMTTNSPASFTNRDAHSIETSRQNQIVSPGLAQSQNSIPEIRRIPHSDDRQLPPREVTRNSIEETYVLFIMCCNPSVPLSTDSTELRRGFNSPPKSDGKTFQTFTLFELIRKLELKELKTWAQLAIELGVEPPVLEKGQSAQKVQQYAVRLKRWMHAMHVDAFFEYLLGKPHVYYTQIPTPDEVSEFGRDGVPPEEDLALRALLPETRPKRGRRKAEDKENEIEDERSPAQRPRLGSPTPSEDFNLARSAHPDHMRRFDDAHLHWTPEPGSATAQNMRWRIDDANTPLSAHPHSAVISRSNDPFLAPENEPRSAVTPTASRSRRRHGPAVSSAWPSSGNNTSGKLRGRPPSNRSITDGPFSTFPANPNTRISQTINLRENACSDTPIVDRSDEPMFSFPPTFQRAWREKEMGTPQKPDRLHLQVPERVGGTVRLATPPPPPLTPPTVVINGGVENEEDSSNQSSFTRSASSQQHYTQNPSNEKLHYSQTPERDIYGYLNTPHREEPQRTNSTSNQHQEHHQEPPTSSQTPTPKEPPPPPPPQPQAPIPSLNFSYKDEPEPGSERTNIDDLEAHFRLRILSAEWSDINGQPCDSCTIETADLIVKQTIRNLRDESATQEAFLINLAALAGGRTLMTKLKMKVMDVEIIGEGSQRERKTTFESRWTLRFGAVEGSFTIQQHCSEKLPDSIVEAGGVRRERIEEKNEVPVVRDADTDDAKMWKKRYLELQDRFYQKDDRVWGIRKSVLDVLAATAADHIV